MSTLIVDEKQVLGSFESYSYQLRYLMGSKTTFVDFFGSSKSYGG